MYVCGTYHGMHCKALQQSASLFCFGGEAPGSGRQHALGRRGGGAAQPTWQDPSSQSHPFPAAPSISPLFFEHEDKTQILILYQDILWAADSNINNKY